VGLRVAPGTGVTVEAERQPDLRLPPPDRPWPWLLLVAVLIAGLATSMGRRWKPSGRLARYEVATHPDLERLFDSATPPEWNGKELELDLRLVGRQDPGHQDLEMEEDGERRPG